MSQDALVGQGRLGGWQAALALRFERRGGRTVLAERRHDGPLVVQKPLYPCGPALCETIIVHPPGGIAGGDRLSLDLEIGAGSQVLLTTPGATRWYRTAGPAAEQQTRIRVGAGACVEWLPQETIVFDAAVGESCLTAEVHASGCFIGWDIVCLGRTGSGERFRRGRFAVRNALYRDGRLAWMESGALDGGGPALEALPVLGGSSVWGTLVASAPGLERLSLADCRTIVPDRGEGTVTRLPAVLLARYRGESTEAARAYFSALWALLRPVLAGVPAVPPRIWQT